MKTYVYAEIWFLEKETTHEFTKRILFINSIIKKSIRKISNLDSDRKYSLIKIISLP